MSGYTPLFGSLTTGTLCGRWPDIGLWPIILSLSDKHGIVDVTPQFISGVTGLPVPDVIACMERFCQPDEYSRTADCDGRRLELVDPDNRPWGWRIVNHGKYREKARLAAKNAREVAEGKNAERMAHRGETAADRRGPPLTDPSNANANANTNIRGEEEPRRKRRSPIPADFELTEKMRDYALKRFPDMDTAATFQHFKDHHTNKGTLGLDWEAGWRTWVNQAEGMGYARAKRREQTVAATSRKVAPSEVFDRQPHGPGAVHGGVVAGAERDGRRDDPEHGEA